MPVKLYWIPFSHPSQAARKMLELKGIPFTVVNVIPLTQRVHLRLAGFDAGTVPAVKLEDDRVQGSRQIARVLETRWPTPALFPADRAAHNHVVDAERWGEEVLQPIPRRLGRFGTAASLDVRRWGARRAGLPAPAMVARITAPAARYYARLPELDGHRADPAAIQADLERLPALLDETDALLARGTLAIDPPNAASLQVLSSVRVLSAFADLTGLLERPCAAAARQLFPDYPEPIPPFLPKPWLAPLGPTQPSTRTSPRPTTDTL